MLVKDRLAQRIEEGKKTRLHGHPLQDNYPISYTGTREISLSSSAAPAIVGE